MDLSLIRKKLNSVLENDPELAPLLIRFAWHCSGTYDKAKRNGGCNGGTMRFEAERNDAENAGFEKAFDLFETVQEEYPGILSYADLYVLGGYVAIEWTGGPHIPFSYGRKDYSTEEAESKYGASLCPFGDGEFNPHGSRLPAADLGSNKRCSDAAPMRVKEKPTIDHIRNTFGRMGFNDRETVALIILGHQYGRCHPEVSGFDGPWYMFAPNSWNIYAHGLGYLSIYTMALDQYREVYKPSGKRQYENRFGGGTWMMLIADMALVWDPSFRAHVEEFDQNRFAFKREASAAWKKLTELGCEGILTPERGS